MPGELLFEPVARVGLGAGQAFVQRAGEGIDVGPGIGRAGGEPFGGSVGRAAHDHPGAGEFGGRGVMGDTEADQVDEVVPGQQRIGRFDVAMHQPDGMRGVQRFGRLLDDAHRPLGAHRPVAPEQTVDVDASTIGITR